MLPCDCKSINFHGGVRERLIEDIIGVVQLFGRKCKIEKTPKYVLGHEMTLQNKYSMVY